MAALSCFAKYEQANFDQWFPKDWKDGCFEWCTGRRTGFKTISKHMFWNSLEEDLVAWTRAYDRCNQPETEEDWPTLGIDTLSKILHNAMDSPNQKWKRTAGLCFFYNRYSHNAIKCKDEDELGKPCKFRPDSRFLGTKEGRKQDRMVIFLLWCEDHPEHPTQITNELEGTSEEKV